MGKDPDDGKDWEQEKKGVTEDKMVGDYITDVMDMTLCKLSFSSGKPDVLQSMGLQSQTWLSDWTSVATDTF